MSAAFPLAVGDRLPELRRTLRAADLVAYAGATWDWHRLHYDQAFTSSRALPAPIVDGQMLGALLAEHVQDALGPRSRVVRMSFRFRTLVFADEEVVVTGDVTAVEPSDDGHRVTVTHSIQAPGGTAIKDAVTVAEVW